MKKGLIIGIIIGVIVLAIVGIGGYFIFNDIMQKSKIAETFSEIENLTKSGNFDIEVLNEKTSTIVSSGKYASVEKAGKNYAKDLFNTSYELKTILEDEKMSQLLSASNYQNDGPEFVETQKYITETKQKLEDGKAKMLSYLDESKINSYIEAETSDEYCKELYRQLLAEDINMPESEKKQLETTIDKIVSSLDIAKEVIDFLIENKGKWEVEGEQVLFDSNTLVVKYNSFLTRLRMV